MTKRVITYGTFDLLHIGHIRLLKRLAALGDELVVAVSTDEFNELKGKKSVYSYSDRAEIIASLAFVDKVIPESSWEQKVSDVQELGIEVFAIGSDWEGKFDHLKDYCEVVYLPRTDGISSSQIKGQLNKISADDIDKLHEAIEILALVKKNLR